MTKEEALVLIAEKEHQIESDLLNPTHYVNDLLSSSPKKNFYNNWAELLEIKYNIEGTPELIPKISNVIRRKLISLNKDTQITWMYEVLRFKYKQHKTNYSETYGEHTESSSPNINYELENKPYIDMLDHYVTTIEAIITKLKTTEFLTKKDKKENLLLDPGRIQSDITILNAACDLLADVWDNRKEVSIYTQHFLIAMMLRFNAGHATGAYLGFIKDFGAKAMKKSSDNLDNLLSPKQAGKIMRGLTKELHARYDPKDKDDAQLLGFYGDQCECDSWRVSYETIYNNITEMLERKCKCHKCNNIWMPKMEVLPGSRGVIIDQEETV